MIFQIGAGVITVVSSFQMLMIGRFLTRNCLRSHENFPLRLRARAAALGAVGNRVSSGLVPMSFLSVSQKITVGEHSLSFQLFQLFPFSSSTNAFQKQKENHWSKLSCYLKMSLTGGKDVEQLVQKQ